MSGTVLIGSHTAPKKRKRGSRRVLGGVIALAVAAPLALVGVSPAMAEPPPSDIARTGTAVASTEFPDPARFAASFVNDGDPSTRWGSDYAHGDEEPSYPHSDHDPTNDWIYIELATASPVYKVTLDWQGAFGRKYDIQTSTDGTTWNTVRAVEDGHAGVSEFVLDITDPVKFVKMQGREASPWGYSLFSFEVWDTKEVIPEPDPSDWEHGLDIAPNGTASAASVYTGNPQRFAASNVNDRESSTRWGSDYARDGIVEPPASSHNPANDWIQIALKEPSPVWSVVLDWETARPAKYLLQTSDDGTTWTTVREVSGVAAGKTEYRLGLTDAVSFVRMQGVSTATTFGYSLWSFEVWTGPKAPAEPGGIVVPAPVSQEATDGDPFVLSADSRIVVNDDAATADATFLAEKLRPATGFALPVVNGTARTSDVSIVLADDEAPGTSALAIADGYTLQADATGLRIGAAETRGVFNAAQTLLQLLPAEIAGTALRPGPWAVEATTITDYPRYAHRGVMLDPARNFITVDGVKQIVDELAAMKGSRLHMHLSDDQGWRIEITKWPKLTEIGGSMSMPGGTSGFYTKAEFADIIAYATARHIEVIPEFDLPGHSSAAIASYPELGCGSSNTICTTSATVDGFVNDVIGEIAPMATSDLFHIGGDESISGQPYIDFIKKIEGFVMDHDKRMVGWTPLPMAGLDSSSVHQYWRDQSYESQPEWWSNDNQVILTPTSKVYLDYPYPGFNSESTHNWDPTSVIDDYLGVSLQSLGLRDANVIGIEGAAWGENNPAGVLDVEHKVFPRLAALLDLAWSPQERTQDTDSFLERLAVQGSRWQFGGTNFWPDHTVSWTTTAAGSLHQSADTAETANEATGYEIDGSVATIASPVGTLGQYSATIEWGDGTSSTGVITGTTGSGKRGNTLYEVTGAHSYVDATDQTGRVVVTGPNGESFTVPLLVRIEAEVPPTDPPTDPGTGTDPGAGTTPGTVPGSNAAPGDDLASTGSDVVGLLALVLALLIGGGVALTARKRRRGKEVQS
jgi:hexosaminidase